MKKNCKTEKRNEDTKECQGCDQTRQTKNWTDTSRTGSETLLKYAKEAKLKWHEPVMKMGSSRLAKISTKEA